MAASGVPPTLLTGRGVAPISTQGCAARESLVREAALAGITKSVATLRVPEVEADVLLPAPRAPLDRGVVSAEGLERIIEGRLIRLHIGQLDSGAILDGRVARAGGGVERLVRLVTLAALVFEIGALAFALGALVLRRRVAALALAADALGRLLTSSAPHVVLLPHLQGDGGKPSDLGPASQP